MCHCSGITGVAIWEVSRMLRYERAFVLLRENWFRFHQTQNTQPVTVFRTCGILQFDINLRLIIESTISKQLHIFGRTKPEGRHTTCTGYVDTLSNTDKTDQKYFVPRGKCPFLKYFWTLNWKFSITHTFRVASDCVKAQAYIQSVRPCRR